MREMFTFAVGFVLVVAMCLGIFVSWKYVQVWSAAQSGRAVLAEAEFSRQARVMEAQAKMDAAKLEGQAELTRAEFSAKANKELAAGLGGSEGYLRYMYIRMLEEQDTTGSTVIYIPTEAGMPILESGRATQQLKGE